MEIGILEDGSLSVRKKGDIFWKVYKLLLRAEKIHKSFTKAKKEELTIKEITERYKDPKYITADEPDGSEFRDYPATAAGRDIFYRSIVRAMRLNDKYAREGRQGKFESTLTDALTVFFASYGFDVKSHSPITEDRKASAKRVYRSVADNYYKEYLKAFGQEKESTPVPVEEGSYHSVRLAPAQFQSFFSYIPDNYLGQLKNGSMDATAYYLKESDSLIGVVLTANHNPWFEIVWVSMAEDSRNEESVLSLLNCVTEEARARGQYAGAFFEMHEGTETDAMKEMVARAGYTVHTEKDNMYEYKLADSKLEKPLLAAAQKFKCVSVEAAGDDIREKIETRLFDERRPVPVAIPIPWKDYRQDLSFIYIGENDENAGLMLVSEIGNAMVIELLYGTDPAVMAALVGAATLDAQKVLPMDKTVLVPIVNDLTRPLIEKLAPNAKRGTISQAIRWF